MKQGIIRETITELGEDTKFIRLATVTMFIHSLIFTILIVRYAQYFLEESVIQQFVDLFYEFLAIGSGWMVPLIIVGIVLAVGYWLLPPVGEAAMIIYREEGRKQGTVSLTKGFGKFFPMFEFHAATGLFEIYVLLFALARVYTLGILDNPLVIILMIIYILVTIFVEIFFAYSKMYITIDGDGFFTAMKRSAKLAIRNIGITVKFSLLTFILNVRFILNILILVGVPIAVIYVGTMFGLDSIFLLKISFIIGMVLLVFLVAYIEGIIEAFFITCRWKVWKRIKHTNE